MRKSKFSEHQYIAILKAVEAGRMVKDVCREHEISEADLLQMEVKVGIYDSSRSVGSISSKPQDSRYPSRIKTTGDLLRARRLDLGLDQKEVAATLGVTADSISYWENNRVQPSRCIFPGY